jgi:PAS domain S-box-containing protein
MNSQLESCADFWNDIKIRCIVENVVDGIIIIDVKGRIRLFNPAAERLFGYTANELIGKNVNVLIPPGDRERHDGYIERYFRTGEKHILAKGREVEGQRRDGSTFPMYLSVGEININEIKCFIGITHDLSAQKAASLQIAKASEFMQAIVDSTPSILVGLDNQGRVTHWNQSATKERNLNAIDAVGQPFAELFPFLGVTTLDLLQVITTAIPLKRTGVAHLVDSETRYMDLIVFPLTSHFNGAVARIDDVTERIRIEEIMVETEKMMSVTGLAAGTAHEINTPLSIISQGCQNIQQRISPDLDVNQKVAKKFGIDLLKVQQYFIEREILVLLDGIQNATTRCSHIVGELLDYSRRHVSSFVEISLHELIDVALYLIRHDFSLRGSIDLLRIKIHRTGDETISIRCDKIAIEQVLFNLLRNAVQSVGSCVNLDTPEITIKVMDDNELVQIEVTDNGIGMCEEVARRVFEPFFTTKPIGVGTGLGLAVAYFIVTNQHNGEIKLITSPNHGARFIVRLPKQGATSRN